MIIAPWTVARVQSLWACHHRVPSSKERMIFWLNFDPGWIGHCVIYSGPSVHGYLGMLTPCLPNNNYMLKLVLIFGLTKDGMQQYIVMVTRGINCTYFNGIETNNHKVLFKFDFISKAIYCSPLLEIKECMSHSHAVNCYRFLRYPQDLPVNGDVFFSFVINVNNDRLSFLSIYSWSWKLSIYC